MIAVGEEAAVFDVLHGEGSSARGPDLEIVHGEPEFRIEDPEVGVAAIQSYLGVEARRVVLESVNTPGFPEPLRPTGSRRWDEAAVEEWLAANWQGAPAHVTASTARTPRRRRGPRTCDRCGVEFVGRVDARYCGGACRVAAHRARRTEAA